MSFEILQGVLLSAENTEPLNVLRQRVEHRRNYRTHLVVQLLLETLAAQRAFTATGRLRLQVCKDFCVDMEESSSELLLRLYQRARLRNRSVQQLNEQNTEMAIRTSFDLHPCTSFAGDRPTCLQLKSMFLVMATYHATVLPLASRASFDSTLKKRSNSFRYSNCAAPLYLSSTLA